MSQSYPPRYRYATELELLDLGDDAEWLKAHARKPKAKRKRRHAADAEVFDVKRWKLSPRWRNDKRVGDSVIGKMLAGVGPGRVEALAAGELGQKG